MSRKDRFHQAVKRALEKDGWTITHDPLPLNVGLLRLAVDLGAEKLIIAQKQNKKLQSKLRAFSEPQRLLISIMPLVTLTL